MSVSNDSIVEVLLIHQQIFQPVLTEGLVSKVSFAILMSLFFTYLNAIMVYTLWTRSITSNKDSAAKAHKTVLLHIIQLSLCLTSFLYSIIERAAATSSTSTSLFVDLRYLNYLFVLILPRCLSPLIYGLRDDAVRPLFIYYFRCATGKRRSTVNVH
ncbi:odorant receptor 131-2-like [Tachysurus ichikawai]